MYLSIHRVCDRERETTTERASHLASQIVTLAVYNNDIHYAMRMIRTVFVVVAVNGCVCERRGFFLNCNHYSATKSI